MPSRTSWTSAAHFVSSIRSFALANHPCLDCNWTLKMYRKRPVDEVWHWRNDCPESPKRAYRARMTEPSGEMLCDQCRKLDEKYRVARNTGRSGHP